MFTDVALNQGNLQPRLERLRRELAFAWSIMPESQRRSWASRSAELFGRALLRRGSNLVGLVSKLVGSALEETFGFVHAHKRGEIKAHAAHRFDDAKLGAAEAWEATCAAVARMKAAYDQDPATTAQQLLVGALAALVISGGPDADGGGPDLDLLMGIDAHRSIFTHSVLTGAVLETALLSLGALATQVHAFLPEDRDPLWDGLHRQTVTFLHAANVGTSVGLAYHLTVDGLIEPAAYKDLPLAMPMEMHESLFVANAAAEAIDVARKDRPPGDPEKIDPALGFPRSWLVYAQPPPPLQSSVGFPSPGECSRSGISAISVSSPGPASTDSPAVAAGCAVPATSQGGTISALTSPRRPLSIATILLEGERVHDQALVDAARAHNMYLRRRYTPHAHARQILSERQLELVSRFYPWLAALDRGRLEPITEEQRQFIRVSRGLDEPRTEMEVMWRQFQRASELRKARRPVSVGCFEAGSCMSATENKMVTSASG